jgi:hypothetical protein
MVGGHFTHFSYIFDKMSVKILNQAKSHYSHKSFIYTIQELCQSYKNPTNLLSRALAEIVQTYTKTYQIILPPISTLP